MTETTVTPYRVGYFVGSLSKDSLNRRVANALIRLAPAELAFEEVIIDDLPLYNRDFDLAYPEPGVRLKQHIQDVDALLFVTPEHNRSIPGPLKNAIDWGSRPAGHNSFNRKPSAVVGTSPGKIGTAVAQQHLRSILSFCNAPQMNAPEVYLQYTPGLVDDDFQVTDPGTAEFLEAFLFRFADYIHRVLPIIPSTP